MQHPSCARALGHVVLDVTSLARSVPFYVQAFGLRVVGRTDEADRSRIGDIVFLSFGANHHDIGLREMPAFDRPAGAAHPSPRAGLAHVAFRLGDSIDDLEQLVRRLTRAGAQGVRAADHGATLSVYFNDPDGLALEAYVGDDTLPDEPLSIVAMPLPIDVDTGALGHNALSRWQVREGHSSGTGGTQVSKVVRD